MTTLAQTQTQANETDSLSRFYQKAPKKPYCANDLGSGLLIRPKAAAFKYRHVQHNPPALRQWLTFDIDHSDLFRWERENLPEPNLIVRNQTNRKHHLHYEIVPVCTSDAAHPKPMYYCEAVSLAITEKLGADPRYTGLITKNPFHPDFHVWEKHDHIYTLGELADFLDLRNIRYRTRKRAANSEVFGISRNCTLFDRTRFWSYDNVNGYREYADYNQWCKAVLERCEAYNDFPDALPYSEVRATAKSVSKWVWTHYFPEGKKIRRGAMKEQLNGSQNLLTLGNQLDLPLSAKQRLSARRTNQLQKDASRERIIEAIGQLIAQGKKPSKAGVARLTGMAESTLRRSHADLFQS